MEKFFVPVAALLLVLVCFGFVPQLAVLTRNRVAATTSSCVPPQGARVARSTRNRGACMPIRFYGEEACAHRAAEATRMFRD